jgi:SAM-dependent methyltransferase
MTYRPDGVAAYFDELADGEWDRLEQTLQGRIRYAIHRRFLDEMLDGLPEGARILDVGCGPGRFAIDMLRTGARVTLADLSQGQLDLARGRVEQAGLLEGVDGFERLDVTDLSRFDDASFDAVVCYGGVLSYARESRPDAIAELRRVNRPGGPLLVSVMSLYGAYRLLGPLDAASYLKERDRHAPWETVVAGEPVVLTAADSTEFHQPVALFTADGLREGLEAAGLTVERMATANPLVPGPVGLAIEAISGSDEASAALMELELALCDRPALLDAGEHLIALGRR